MRITPFCLALLGAGTFLVVTGCGDSRKAELEKENPITTVKPLQEENAFLKRQVADLEKKVQMLEVGGSQAVSAVRQELKEHYESQLAQVHVMHEEEVSKLKAESSGLREENTTLRETVRNLRDLTATSARLPETVKSNFAVERMIWFICLGMLALVAVVLVSMYYRKQSHISDFVLAKAATVRAIEVDA